MSSLCHHQRWWRRSRVCNILFAVFVFGFSLYISILFKDTMLSKSTQIRIRLMEKNKVEETLLNLLSRPSPTDPGDSQHGSDSSHDLPQHPAEPQKPPPPEQPGEMPQENQDRQMQDGHQEQAQQQQTKKQHHPDSAKERMNSRLAQAKKYCSSQKKKSNQTSPLHVRFHSCPLLSVRHRSYFCPIAKIGSTFWARFYKILLESSSDTLISPYQIPLDVINSHRCVGNVANGQSHADFMKTVFVREPFSRMFSAYVDKLISPNPIYWRKWGRPAMSLDKATGCGQAVTFRQFFRFVTKTLYMKDNHVIPMTSVCDPCEHHFDVIGSMETFPDDLSYMMSLLNVNFRGDVHLSRETRLDAIYDSIQGPYSWIENIKKCISTPEMGRRIWRKLQIRGLISSSIQYPLGEKNLSDVTLKQFYRTAVDAHDKSTARQKLSHQKKQAFVESFLTVPLADLRDFVQVFGDDFEAFGYEKFPSSVFKRDSQFINTEALNFNKPWIIPEEL